VGCSLVCLCFLFLRFVPHLIYIHTNYSPFYILVQACEAFTDRVDGLGEVVLPGSFPLLGRLFGDGAFNMGGARFESFVSSNTHDLSSARALREHWAAMRARAAPEAGAAPGTGPLSQGVHQAGLQASMSEDSNDHTPSCPRLQHALCDQLEQRQARRRCWTRR